jgi:putative DNA primase/helicase
MNIKEVASRALAQSESLLSSWLPGGSRRGNEWVCGSLSGEAGKSCSINLNTGKWADFSTGQKGGDLVSLLAAIRGINQVDAAHEVAHIIGYQNGAAGKPKPTPPPKPTVKLIPPPEPAKRSQVKHAKYGDPTAIYKYLSADSKLLFYVLRYDFKDDEGVPAKELRPLSFTEDGKWVFKGWPTPRPLYNLPAVQGSERILIVEGEKACEAAKLFAPTGTAVITWPNGGNAWDKTDWSPIYGKPVLIWPDHDEPGRIAASKIAAHLLTHCPEVAMISTITDGLPNGWDAADSGFTMIEFLQWVSLRTKLITQPKSVEPELPPMPTEPPPNVTNIMIAGDEAISEMTTKLSPNVASNIQRCQLQASKQGIPTENILNVGRVLTCDFTGKFWFDEFYRSFYTSINGEPEPLHDSHIFYMQTTLQALYGLRKVSKSLVTDAITSMSYQDRRNSAKDYFLSLKWDGAPRMEDFFCNAYGAADTPLNQAISRYFFSSIMARFFGRELDPIYGNKVDSMVVIEGDQGIAKGMGLKHLISEKWHYEASKDIKDKDFFQDMKGKIIAEVAELDIFDRQGVKTLRRVLTCQVDRLRVSYGRESEDFDRACIFVGTTNETEYLEDDKGNRRFLPITATKVDINYIRDNREQLFAEALEYYRENVSHWWSMPKDLKAEHEKRMVQTVADDYTTYIAEYLAKPTLVGVSVPDIWVNCFKQDLGKITQKNRNDISRSLRQLGYINKVEWDSTSNKATRVWTKPYVRPVPPGHQLHS